MREFRQLAGFSQEVLLDVLLLLAAQQRNLDRDRPV